MSKSGSMRMCYLCMIRYVLVLCAMRGVKNRVSPVLSVFCIGYHKIALHVIKKKIHTIPKQFLYLDTIMGIVYVYIHICIGCVFDSVIDS